MPVLAGDSTSGDWLNNVSLKTQCIAMTRALDPAPIGAYDSASGRLHTNYHPGYLMVSRGQGLPAETRSAARSPPCIAFQVHSCCIETTSAEWTRTEIIHSLMKEGQ
ncbi:hypothetical protein PDE_00229 [Penicillium oxalicum 114-2]|uniref:Uncharacterized protein n=1 Tax=Penicillium oxalicum (strain 114-2 / CGMCC 5302) TaxID=933388 RepID=S7Z9E8_PENO1|nr:hypothetical protein PDE_00229 [Penicillium oxalicum 114-2]